MALYICDECASAHKLTLEIFTTVNPCELCGFLNDDWSVKFCTLTHDLIRPVGELRPTQHLKDQLAAIKAAKEKA